MKFLNETQLSIGQYRITDNNNKTYQLNVEKDCCPTDPRTYEDNLGTMLCSIDYRYYGDCNSEEDAGEQLDMICRSYGKTQEENDKMSCFGQTKFLTEQDNILALPLYLFEDSGLSLTTSEQDEWDGSFTGLIFVEKELFLSACPIKDTEHWKEYAKKTLLAEVEAYNQYLKGEFYMWTIQDCVKTTRQDSEGNILSVTFEPEEEMGFEYIFGDYHSLPTVQDIREQFGEFKEIQRIE